MIACLAVVRPAAQVPTATTLLDRYAQGDFDGVVSTLAGIDDFGDIFNELKHHGPTWIEAGGPAERSRRELVAATFALEASRAGEWRHWKLVQHVNLYSPIVVPSGPIDLGLIDARVVARFLVKMTGRDVASSGYRVGLDRIVFTPE